MDGWQPELDLQLTKHTEHFVKLGINVWHVRMEGVFVRATVVALESFVLATGGCSNLLGRWIWETYRRGGSSISQSGFKEKMEPTDPGRIPESRGSFLLCARDH